MVPQKKKKQKQMNTSVVVETKLGRSVTGGWSLYCLMGVVCRSFIQLEKMFYMYTGNSYNNILVNPAWSYEKSMVGVSLGRVVWIGGACGLVGGVCCVLDSIVVLDLK